MDKILSMCTRKAERKFYQVLNGQKLATLFDAKVNKRRQLYFWRGVQENTLFFYYSLIYDCKKFQSFVILFNNKKGRKDQIHLTQIQMFLLYSVSCQTFPLSSRQFWALKWLKFQNQPDFWKIPNLNFLVVLELSKKIFY